jgi:hypothetical protein
MQMSIGLDRLKRFVCLLLIFVLLFCFFMCPRASAVALEATTIAYGGLLVGTILVGAGVVFSSHGDMVKVGNAMYKTLVNGSSAIGKTISSISAWAVEHGTSLAKGALRVGKDLYQGIVDAFNASYSDGSFVAPSVSVLLQYSSFNDDWYTFFRDARYTSVQIVADGELVCSLSVSLVGTVWTYKFSGLPATSTDVSSYVSKGYIHPCVMLERYGDGSLSLHPRLYDDNGDFYKGGGSGGIANFEKQTVVANLGHAVAVPQPDLKYPSDDYLVRMPDIPSVDTATGDVTYPNDTAYTKDAVAVPYPVDSEGVKVPDIPFDKVVDKSTGKTMDDTGTDTDTPSKPGEGTDTDKPSVNWPSAGDISLPKLIISKFPFCIPFDVARLIGLLEADPKTPIFHVPLKVGTILNDEIVLDLSQWDNAVRIIRWGELIVFVAGLVLVTRNYIKW